MKAFFNATFFQPLYNGLVLLAGTLPGNSLGLSIVVLTVVVRAALTPFSHRASETQRRLKAIEPELKLIKEKYSNKEEQARKIMELYKEHKINPFGSLLPILVQLPILLALFFVFRDGVMAHSDLLYSFVFMPSAINSSFLGLDLASRSFLLAVILFATQFYQSHLTAPQLSTEEPGKSFKGDLARSMNVQIRYVLPVMIALISLSFPAAVALYWLTGNLFTIGYELWRRRSANAVKV